MCSCDRQTILAQFFGRQPVSSGDLRALDQIGAAQNDQDYKFQKTYVDRGPVFSFVPFDARQIVPMFDPAGYGGRLPLAQQIYLDIPQPWIPNR